MIRRRFLLSLAALALVAGGCATTGASRTSSTLSANPNLITTAEIDAANLRDAYQVVEHLRPTWISRGTAPTVNMGGAVMNNPVTGATGSGGPRGGVIVYYEDSKQGWLEALRDIPASQVGSIQWLDAATATAILPGLGSDIITGAIVVHHRSGM